MNNAISPESSTVVQAPQHFALLCPQMQLQSELNSYIIYTIFELLEILMIINSNEYYYRWRI